jgi:UDP-N-acetyl-D-mannosaminuronic acid transferase (WecB/TagA/CpsF family)
MKLWRGQPENWVWKPTAHEIAYAWIGLGAMFVLLAAYEFRFPSASHTGRLSWLYNAAIATLGPRGVVILYAAIASAFLIFGIRKLLSSRGTGVA